MSYTAIILDTASAELCASRARALGFQWERTLCHHVTLAMGAAAGFTLGERRALTVTHAGRVAGRVAALRVTGAEDSKNSVPHVTIGTNGAGKPKDSNAIETWEAVEPFAIFGVVAA